MAHSQSPYDPSGLAGNLKAHKRLAPFELSNLSTAQTTFALSPTLHYRGVKSSYAAFSSAVCEYLQDLRPRIDRADGRPMRAKVADR